VKADQRRRRGLRVSTPNGFRLWDAELDPCPLLLSTLQGSFLANIGLNVPAIHFLTFISELRVQAVVGVEFQGVTMVGC
jgi:hypothetical protein